jgi:trans-aconitate methyltransferase
MARVRDNRQKHEGANPIQARLISRFHAEVVRLAEQANPSSLLDVGCGEGYVLAALEQAGVRAQLAGVDRSPTAIAEARTRLGGEIELRVADARTLVEARGQHDLVMMIEVLEHLDDPDAMLRELEQLTSRFVLLSVPWEPYFRMANLLRLRNVTALGNHPEHVNNWGRRGFQQFVESRFGVRERVTAFPWTLVLAER